MIMLVAQLMAPELESWHSGMDPDADPESTVVYPYSHRELISRLQLDVDAKAEAALHFVLCTSRSLRLH